MELSKMNTRLCEIYVNWRNNPSVDRFAEYYGISAACAIHLIDAARQAWDERSLFLTALEKRV